MKKLLMIPLVFAGLFCLGGIIRNDVPEREYAALAAQPQYTCVGRWEVKGRSVGSCVLIAPRFVLSAAHCLNDYHGVAAGKIVVELNGIKIKAANYFLQPGYRGTGAYGCDLVLIELAQPVTGISLPELNAAFDEKGGRATAIGYGAFATAIEGKQKERYPRLGGENMIDSTGLPVANGKDALLFCDMDAPDHSINRMGSADPLPLEWSPNGGDSGGGLFRQREGATQLIGIVAGGGVEIPLFYEHGHYGQISCYTRVAAFKPWVDSMMAVAEHQ